MTLKVSVSKPFEIEQGEPKWVRRVLVAKRFCVIRYLNMGLPARS